MFNSIDELRSQLGGNPKSNIDPEYQKKMLHPIPADAKEVKRDKFILDHVKGKRVLDFGASGPMHDAIVKASASCVGVDREDGPGVIGFDLDDVKQDGLPISDPEIIICGEVVEHLGNPQHFLSRLKKQYPGIPVIITVPNAFNRSATKWLARGFENVNGDHVAWYSPKTLSVLLQRSGYDIGGLYFYNGNGPDSEGLVVVTE